MRVHDESFRWFGASIGVANDVAFFVLHARTITLIPGRDKGPGDHEDELFERNELAIDQDFGFQVDNDGDRENFGQAACQVDLLAKHATVKQHSSRGREGAAGFFWDEVGIQLERAFQDSFGFVVANVQLFGNSCCMWAASLNHVDLFWVVGVGKGATVGSKLGLTGSNTNFQQVQSLPRWPMR